MKRQGTADELAEHWTLHPQELDVLANKSGATRLGFAALLKYFQYEGKFPLHKSDLPTAVIVFLARQLALPPELYAQYRWAGRTIAFHRTQIRHALTAYVAQTRWTRIQRSRCHADTEQHRHPGAQRGTRNTMRR